MGLIEILLAVIALVLLFGKENALNVIYGIAILAGVVVGGHWLFIGGIMIISWIFHDPSSFSRGLSEFLMVIAFYGSIAFLAWVIGSAGKWIGKKIGPARVAEFKKAQNMLLPLFFIGFPLLFLVISLFAIVVFKNQ